MKIIYCLLLLIAVISCSDSTEKKFVATKYSDDLDSLTFRQIYSSPINGEFIGIFWKPWGLGGHKVLKLYSADSISIAELDYGEHPMEIISWKDSLIVLNAYTWGSKEDSAYIRWYLDNSVDKNNRIGIYKLIYHKSYDRPD
jgi:hypothetical protein